MKAGTNLFRSSVRETLTQHCLKCHGGEKVRGDFDLSSRESLLESGYVELKAPASSFLLAVMRHDEEPTMPPTGEAVSDERINVIQEWIASGAPYDKPLVEKGEAKSGEMKVTASDRDFWSFRPLADSPEPADPSGWSANHIDRFVFDAMQRAGLRPNPMAEKRDLIRRAYLDVIGLPPTTEQLDAALGMTHSQLVDELLESAHYGERWARHWLDAARFAESHGFEQDYDRKFAYHFRDFVIKALNADMPWDQFVRWQIAGDEIAPEDPLAMMATGFLGAGVFPTQLTEKEFESARYDELDDMAATVGTAMLGLTIGCARCHDHKFDPLPVSDYYRFVSTFTTTIRSEIDVDLDPKAYQAKLAAWETEHRRLVAQRDALKTDSDLLDRFDRWLAAEERTQMKAGEWAVLEMENGSSTANSTKLTQQADGAILASGSAAAKETYTIKSDMISGPVSFIRIEALTDSSMSRGGPGRAGNGNFALSDFKLYAIDAKARRREIQLRDPRATHEQNNTFLSVASAIDDDPSGTGWAVDFGGIGKDQAAVFGLTEPLDDHDGVRLEFHLKFANNAQHSLGRFRLSVSSRAQPQTVVGGGQNEALSSALKALAQARQSTTSGAPGEFKLGAKHREVFFDVFCGTDSRWSKADEKVQRSLKEKPTPQRARVQVSSEGFPPTKHHADGRGFPHFYSQTHFLRRGDPNQKLGVAEPGFLQVLMRQGKQSKHWQRTPPEDWTRTSYRRTGMAEWITDTDYGAGHLLARVIVNRVWHHHFGRGIVATPNDFGLQGTPPTHPELLEHLARRLIDSGWRLKSLHRDILCSATWRQSTAVSPEKMAIDPENQWWWRYPIRRLEAEVVRDSMLAASGQLDRRMFGPGTLDARQKRRSIYFMIKRSRLVPMMQIFDQPEPLSSQGSRPSTTIAPQALLFMNNPNVVGWAKALADSLAGNETDDAIREIYLRTLARNPTEEELDQNREFVDVQSASYQESGVGKSDAGRAAALADLCQVVFGLNEFIYLP